MECPAAAAPGPQARRVGGMSIRTALMALVPLVAVVVAVVAVTRWSHHRQTAREQAERADRSAQLATFLEAVELERSGRPTEALQRLQDCPPALRHWEWQWLERRLNPRCDTLSCGAAPLAVGVSPAGEILSVTSNGFVRCRPGQPRMELFARLPRLGEREALEAAANHRGAVAAVARWNAEDSIVHQAGMGGAGGVVSWRLAGTVSAVSAPSRLGSLAFLVRRDPSFWLEVRSREGALIARQELDSSARPVAVRFSDDGRRCLLLSGRVGSMNLPSEGTMFELTGRRLRPVPVSIQPSDRTLEEGLDQACFGPDGMLAGAGEAWRIDFGRPSGSVPVGAPFSAPTTALELSPGGTLWTATDGASVALLGIDRADRETRSLANFPVLGSEIVCLSVCERADATRSPGDAGGVLAVGMADGTIRRYPVADLADPSELEITGLVQRDHAGMYFEGGHMLRLVQDPRRSVLKPGARRFLDTGWLALGTNGPVLDGQAARVFLARGQALIRDQVTEGIPGARLVRLSDETEPKVLADLRGQGWSLQSVSPDLRQAALVRRGESAVLEMASGRLWRITQPPGETLRPLAVDGDGRQAVLLRGRGDRAEVILTALTANGDALDYRVVRSLSMSHGGADAHVFSRDGRRLLTGGRALRLLDAATGVELLKLLDYGPPGGLEPGASVDSIEVSPDEQAILCRTERYGMDRIFRFFR